MFSPNKQVQLEVCRVSSASSVSSQDMSTDELMTSVNCFITDMMDQDKENIDPEMMMPVEPFSSSKKVTDNGHKVFGGEVCHNTSR